MRFGNWESLATVTAAAALVVLAVIPRGQPSANLDSEAVRHAGQAALELSTSGTPVSWDDHSSGLSGSIMPLRVFRSADGQWCRRYVITIKGDRAPTILNRTACRRLDGEWQTVAEPQVAEARS